MYLLTLNGAFSEYQGQPVLVICRKKIAACDWRDMVKWEVREGWERYWKKVGKGVKGSGYGETDSKATHATIRHDPIVRGEFTAVCE